MKFMLLAWAYIFFGLIFKNTFRRSSSNSFTGASEPMPSHTTSGRQVSMYYQGDTDKPVYNYEDFSSFNEAWNQAQNDMGQGSYFFWGNDIYIVE